MEDSAEKNDLQSRLNFMAVDKTTIKTLQSLKPIIFKVLPSVLQKFYTHLGQHPHLAKLFGDEKGMKHAADMQLKHWELIADAKFDEDYIKAATRIGRVHHRLNIEPRWYLAGYAMIISGVVQNLAGQTWNPFAASRKKQIDAFIRGAFIDIDYALTVYNQSLEDEKSAMLKRISEELQQRIGSAAEQTSISVRTIAAAAEELQASLHEVARRIDKLNESTKASSNAATQSSSTIIQMANASQEISGVVKMIQDVTEQTNLLALNATIEAARAGEAGKGFAVVANEVKNLANQTSTAASDITDKIKSMQAVSADVASSIQAIVGDISTICNHAVEMQSNIHQQLAAVHEIARNIAEAATATTEVSSSIASFQRDLAAQSRKH